MISALPGGREFANPGSTSELLTRTRFLLEFNYTDYFTGKQSLVHLSRAGKIEEG